MADDITAADPRVAQILAMIQAKTPAPPVAISPSAPNQSIAPISPVAPPPGLTPPAPPVAPNLNPAAPPVSPAQAPPPAQPTQAGPVKTFLQGLVSGLGKTAYAGTQGVLQHYGIPTDYEKQQNALKIGLQQQQQDSLEGLRAAQANLATGKGAQLDQMMAPYDIAPDDQSVLEPLRGTKTTFGKYQTLQELTANLQGKQGVANTAAGAKESVAKTQADSRERLANAQLEVRKALADRNYGLAAQRLSLAGGNQDLRKLEYNLRAYGTGADGQPVPGVEFDANGRPVGTAAQANIRPTTNARNAGERADTMEDLATRIKGALNDPEIRGGLGPVVGRINDVRGQAGALSGPLAELRNDLVSYGAFQAGLHPVRGIGGLQYFDKVMGGLGQTPEELLAKINSNDSTARSVINVGHGNPPAPSSDTKVFTDGGVTYHIPAALAGAFKKDHPSAR